MDVFRRSTPVIRPFSQWIRVHRGFPTCRCRPGLDVGNPGFEQLRAGGTVEHLVGAVGDQIEGSEKEMDLHLPDRASASVFGLRGDERAGKPSTR